MGERNTFFGKHTDPNRKAVGMKSTALAMMFSEAATNNNEEEDAAAAFPSEDPNNDAAGAAALSDEHPDVGNDDVEGGDPSSDSFLDTASSVPAIAGIPLDNNNSDGPDTNVEGWFNRHALPVTEGVRISLDDWGVACVEQLKLLPSDVFVGMFDSEKLVVRETAVSPKFVFYLQVLSFGSAVPPFIHHSIMLLLCHSSDHMMCYLYIENRI